MDYFPRNPGERLQVCIEGSPDPPDPQPEGGILLVNSYLQE